MVSDKEINDTIVDWVDKFLEKFCEIMVEEARTNIMNSGRDKKGNIAKQITWEKVEDGKYIVKSSHEASGFLEWGTKAHDVFPKVAKALHWTTDGKHFFSKGHRVSGISPTPFMEPAYLITMSKAKEKSL